METSGEMGTREEYNLRDVLAKMSNVGVFHTAALPDPTGLSVYSKSMAEVEVKATENVVEACAMTPSVRKCVLTSSLLACVWQGSSGAELSGVINHDSWSDESFCLNKKLWYALGKLRAEKAAWRIADERGLKLTAICSGLITGPQFCMRNPTATIAYLKDPQDMYSDGLLATVDVMKLAEAHVLVLEAMNKAASGRYICFDQVIDGADKAMKLAQEIGMPIERISGGSSVEYRPRLELTSRKLSAIMSRTFRCCF